MSANSKTLEIIKKLGDARPPQIRLSRLLQSPAQGHFSFRVSSDNRSFVVRFFELLGEESVNLRLITENLGADGEVRIQFCCDGEAQGKVLRMLQNEESSAVIKEFHHVEEAVILSLYPFNGQPQVAGRVFTIFRQKGIEILGANTATSVFSCVVPAKALEAAISNLKQVFMWP